MIILAGRDGKAAATANVAIVTADDLRKLRLDIEKGEKTAARQAAIVTASDIERMKRSTKVTTAVDAATQKKI
jgi:hypothetical protein